MNKRVISTGAWFAFALNIVFDGVEWLYNVSKPHQTTAEVIVQSIAWVGAFAIALAWILALLGVFDEK